MMKFTGPSRVRDFRFPAGYSCKTNSTRNWATVVPEVRCPVPARAGEELTTEVDATPRHVGVTSAAGVADLCHASMGIHLGPVDATSALHCQGRVGADRPDSLVAWAVVGAPPHGTTALAAPICRSRGAQPRARAIPRAPIPRPAAAPPHRPSAAAPARRDPRHLSVSSDGSLPAVSRRFLHPLVLRADAMRRRKQLPGHPSDPLTACVHASICSLLQLVGSFSDSLFS